MIFIVDDDDDDELPRRDRSVAKKTVCFAGEPKGQSDVVVVEAVVVITLDDVVVAVVFVIRLICKSKGHEDRCPLKLHRIRKAQRSRATNASR